MTNNNHIPKAQAKDEIEITEGSVAEHLVTEKFDFGSWLHANINAMGIPVVISLFIHVLGLIILTMLFIQDPVVVADGGKTIIYQPPDIKPEMEMEIPEDLITSDKLPKDDKITENQPVWKDAEVAERTETADEDDAREALGESYDFVSDKPLNANSVLDALGLGGGASGRYGGPRGGRIETVAPGGGGQPGEREKVVSSGLLWLARHQNPDGSWGAVSFQNQCANHGSPLCQGTGQKDFDLGLTGLALLAFTGANYSPGSMSKYDTFNGIRFGDVVRKAALFLKSIQKENGMYGDGAMLKFMYNQAICAYAMADLYCVMKDKKEQSAYMFKDAALKGAQFIIDSQNNGKAWRYKPKDGDSDMSVSGWCMMALKTAEDAELLTVPQNVWAGVKSHLDDVTDLAYGGVGYRERGNVAILAAEKDKWDSGKLYTPPSLTAIGVMCRIFMGQNRKDAAIANSAQMLVEESNLPKWLPDNYGKVDYYYWFYGTYALNQFDGTPKNASSCWSKWEKEMLPAIIKNQRGKKDGCANGSWEPVDRWSAEGGRVYSTAICVLTLEVYYRLRIVEDK
ncbi:MAG: hypothetical protein HY811_02185 [Planctomycetes bacterium]|nr:hypothetical protein [Planctomycetota bacterium]